MEPLPAASGRLDLRVLPEEDDERHRPPVVRRRLDGPTSTAAHRPRPDATVSHGAARAPHGVGSSGLRPREREGGL